MGLGQKRLYSFFDGGHILFLSLSLSRSLARSLALSLPFESSPPARECFPLLPTAFLPQGRSSLLRKELQGFRGDLASDDLCCLWAPIFSHHLASLQLFHPPPPPFPSSLLDFRHFPPLLDPLPPSLSLALQSLVIASGVNDPRRLIERELGPSSINHCHVCPVDERESWREREGREREREANSSIREKRSGHSSPIFGACRNRHEKVGEKDEEDKGKEKTTVF